MSLIYDEWTGHVHKMKTTLSRSFGQYKSSCKEIKIGITCNPEVRFKQHLKNKQWDKMIVKYKTTSVSYIKEMERYLIDLKWDYEGLANERGGGGGSNSDNGPYYLYFLVLEK